MTPQFRLTEPAIQDIEQIADYIAVEFGLAQSEVFLSKLDAKFAKIAQFTGIGGHGMKIYSVSVASQ